MSRGNATSQIKELTLCLIKAWGKRQDRYKALLTGDEGFETSIKVQVGNAMGEYMNPDEEERVEIQQTRQVLSGRIDLPWEGIPGELKMTWFSKPPEPDAVPSTHAQYVEQVAGYLVAKRQMQNLNHPFYAANLFVGYLGGYAPQFVCWQLTFSPSELDTWQDELLSRDRVVNGDAIPSIEDHWGFECGGKDWSCPLHSRAGGFCPGGKGRNGGFFGIDLIDKRQGG